MNLIIVDEHEIADNRICLADHRAKHIVKVLHSELGDCIKIGILNGKIGIGKITLIRKKYPFMVEIDPTFTSLPPEKASLDIILALPRPIMMRRIFSQIASLGIDTIHIVNASRVEKSFWSAGIINADEYMEHLIHGLEQAVDTIPPTVKWYRKFRPFIEDSLPEIKNSYSDLLLAHPETEKKLHQCIDEHSKKILLAIGPEGGWVDFEVEKFQEQGFSCFTLGQRILKVDTAVINIHGRVMGELERLAK
jgi:16S rRNA (uracil1498-N3)-methyltransferase